MNNDVVGEFEIIILYYHLRNSGLFLSKKNDDIRDVIVTDGHVKIIIGKTDTAFIISEASSKDAGVVVSRHAYTSTKNYSIIKDEKIIDHYGKEDISVVDKKFLAF